jgi:protein tyrosine phosphatase (PTP) superfamily phosphohydrolase (DUF442 family)
MKLNLTNWEIDFLSRYLWQIPTIENEIDRDKFESFQNKIENAQELVLARQTQSGDKSIHSKYLRGTNPRLQQEINHLKGVLNV